MQVTLSDHLARDASPPTANMPARNARSLHKLLTNVAYSGRVKYKSEVHQGEHPAIIAETLWHQVQTALPAMAKAKALWSVTVLGPC